ncbi:hypothetical protein DL766_009513 [Monosporascus sp. MC13-8B]|uniref:BTB domain-containing protein n=1 Tax=Monosporascus cannonballus TaxID=155416 RepID=A0ABY0GYH4_9PEZI|nr:hypothetical protein DL762_008768 [Monosporascus cannonballus]RYO84150.1 hypothetical protein DL763_007579 [Monosporascus cannonballus]RYP15040.1 hypothetical protein DL766_009513 [Monosporascus sp. MC13-8B]
MMFEGFASPLGETEQIELLRTKPIKFIVGQDGAEFYLHPGLVSRLSAPLDALVQRGMEESSEGCVFWKDVDGDVFRRFAKFVYTGSYAGFMPTEKGEPADDDLESTALSELLNTKDQNDPLKLPYSLVSYKLGARIWSCPHSLSSKRKKNEPSSGLFGKRGSDAISCDCGPSEKKLDFISKFRSKYGGSAGASSYGAIFQRTRTTRPTEQALIGDARVWLFAENYGVNALMEVASSRLVHELAEWTISASAFVPKFGKLVRYVYADSTAGCQLRQLLATFAACVVEDVSCLEGWQALLDEVPEFMKDLLKQVTDRLSTARYVTPDPL